MIISCCICWEAFLRKTGNQVCCSKECWKLQEKNKEKERKKDPEYMKSFIERRKISARKDYLKHTERCKNNAKKLRYKSTCVFCLKEFDTYSKTVVTCSELCYRTRMSQNRIWEWNPWFRSWVYAKSSELKSWVHGFKDRKFQKVCKEMDREMIEKYSYKFCEFCLVNNSMRWEHHHIVYRSEKPRHEHIHDRSNIIHLCILCHNDFHRNKWKRNSIVMERKLNLLFWDDILDK